MKLNRRALLQGLAAIAALGPLALRRVAAVEVDVAAAFDAAAAWLSPISRRRGGKFDALLLYDESRGRVVRRLVPVEGGWIDEDGNEVVVDMNIDGRLRIEEPTP